ncbi:MAG TPA: HAMP domain-containing sensor histidine kinase [Candidatus Saccharimonadales bacterium]|jgi:signal transduction histidine kinase|nr:HAMP domain-containing sensor histidine kinase [Candidatus Saccharimonadales bacterium]
MRVTSRTKTVAFVIILGVCLVGISVVLNVGWILNWRAVVLRVLGIIFFGVIIAGVALNTIFLIREIRRNEQQDSFLNAVTHELKTPITSIRLYLETLEKRPVEEKQRHDFYRVMLQDTDRLLGTVEQVLKAGEVRHGRGPKSWQELDFSAMVQEAVELARIRHALPEEALSFGAEPPRGITVLGDAVELRTVAANLLENALKYSGSDRRIVVDVAALDLDKVSLSIRDNGIGIPRSELKRIFNRFYRVRSRATDNVKGTGLGLFIVRSIVRRHGGDISAESYGEGKGSTFRIRLPRVYHV